MKIWAEIIRYVPYSAVVVLLLSAATCTACSAPAPGAALYYLSLGDSLSQGVQPDTAGTSTETAEGYPDLVETQLWHSHPGLRLVQLGCPGETTETMTHGGICRYPGGSQLAAADAFLRAHRGHVLLITIDIGANDPESCGGQSDLVALGSCLGQVPSTATRLSAVLGSLRAAAGPGARVVGMNYYLPDLAEWRHGLPGQAVALVSERLAAAYNRSLDQAYAQAGVKVADVFDAFGTADFGDPVTVPGIGVLPRNVARICEWTWECASLPRGPNQHANTVGYRVMASTVLKAASVPLSHGPRPASQASLGMLLPDTIKYTHNAPQGGCRSLEIHRNAIGPPGKTVDGQPGSVRKFELWAITA